MTQETAWIGENYQGLLSKAKKILKDRTFCTAKKLCNFLGIKISRKNLVIAGNIIKHFQWEKWNEGNGKGRTWYNPHKLQ